MDEGTFNCCSFPASLNVFRVLRDTEEGKEEQQGESQVPAVSF